MHVGADIRRSGAVNLPGTGADFGDDAAGADRRAGRAASRAAVGRIAGAARGVDARAAARTRSPAIGLTAVAHGAGRGACASARNSANWSSGSVHSAIGVQPPARSRMRASRGPYLWLFSVWIVSPAAIAKGRPSTVKVDVARRLQVHLDPRAVVVPDRAVAEGVDRDRRRRARG